MRVLAPVLLVFSVFAGLVLAQGTKAQQSSAQRLNPDQLLNSAIDAQQRGDYQTAIREYRKLLELRPNMVEAKVNLGAALVHVGDFDSAIAMYRSALPSIPQKSAVLLNLALAYYKKGDFPHANEEFETLHSAEPNDVRVAILLGDTDVRLGKAESAIAALEPLEKENVDNLDFQYAYGSALIKAGKRRDGVARMEKVAKSGHSADAYLIAGSTLLDLNEFQAARRDLEAALAIDPKLPRLYSLTGMARDKTGDIKAGEVAFREALKLNPDDFDANLYLGAILYRERNMDEAKPYLDRALRLDSKSAMARYESAMFESTAGQYEAAAQDLEKLIKDDPEWLEPHEELATLYYKLHRPEDGARERSVVEKLTAEQQAKGPPTQ
ncbi:MAG: tetratricopeptide repeat protein [Candidatus Sulfotelmatobacter sp.]